MRTSLIRDMALCALAGAGLLLAPASVAAQEEHAEHGDAAEHQEAGEHQEHAEHVTHEKNEIAVFFGATRRLKFEDDETGGTVGLEYARALGPNAFISVLAEWAAGNIERDWVAMLNVGVQPLEGWAHPLVFYIGSGIEVASIDEAQLHEDEHGGETNETGGTEHAVVLQEEHEEGERETEVDALMRVGLGWAIHVGSFSFIPNINGDIVGEDWSIVGGVTIGYRF